MASVCELWFRGHFEKSLYQCLYFLDGHGSYRKKIKQFE